METFKKLFSSRTVVDVMKDNIGKIVEGSGFYARLYPCQTEDGHVLNLFRLVPGDDPNQPVDPKQTKSTKKIVFQNIGKGRPVLLQHGLIDSSDSWVLNNHEASPGYYLATLGFDVWLGNNRGNKYCKWHSNEKLPKEQFWDFSFQQMGRYDIPAMIKLILKETGKPKLSYIGHSQGTAQMFAALSMPETTAFVNKSVDIFLALAPVVYLANHDNALLNKMCDSNLETYAKKVGLYEMLPGNQNSVESSIGAAIQSGFIQMFPALSNKVYELSDADPAYNNHHRFSLFVKHHPAGSSLRCFEHFKQMIMQSKENPGFPMFDYGPERNAQEYQGSPKPPMFNLANINIPVRGFVGAQDKLSTPADNALLKKTLQIELKKDYDMYLFDQCGHITFMWGREVANILEQIKSDLLSVEQQA